MTTNIEGKLKKIYDDFFLFKNEKNSNGNNTDIEKKLKYLYDEFIKKKLPNDIINIQTATGDVDIISSTINFTKNGDKLDSNIKLSEKTVLTLDNQKRNVIEKETTKL
jgi:hypothetical protein